MAFYYLSLVGNIHFKCIFHFEIADGFTPQDSWALAAVSKETMTLKGMNKNSSKFKTLALCILYVYMYKCLHSLIFSQVKLCD